VTPPTIAQLRNLADRAGMGLTPSEQARLREGINQLEALQQIARGYCPACGRGDAAPTVDDWQRERDRAERAEAANARVRAARNRIAHAPAHTDAIWCLDQLDAALAEPAPATPIVDRPFRTHRQEQQQ
jgi:hypothetical protein